VAQHPFPGPGQDGDQPLPGEAERAWAAEQERYRPSRRLSHLVRARTATCSAPGCTAQAIYSELDHTTAHPAGETCECNLSPLCSRHHHAKHAPGWKLQQPEPVVMRWTLPNGRSHTTRPTRYDE
jgi:hypothetical protein